MTTSSSHHTPDLSNVFTYIDHHREEYLTRLIDYVRRPSISAHGIGIEDVAQYIASIMHSLSLQTRIIPTAGWPMVLGQRLDRPGAPTILLYGHYDVQSPEPLEVSPRPPRIFPRMLIYYTRISGARRI